MTKPVSNEAQTHRQASAGTALLRRRTNIRPIGTGGAHVPAYGKAACSCQTPSRTFLFSVIGR